MTETETLVATVDVFPREIPRGRAGADEMSLPRTIDALGRWVKPPSVRSPRPFRALWIAVVRVRDSFAVRRLSIELRSETTPVMFEFEDLHYKSFVASCDVTNRACSSRAVVACGRAVRIRWNKLMRQEL